MRTISLVFFFLAGACASAPAARFETPTTAPAASSPAPESAAGKTAARKTAPGTSGGTTNDEWAGTRPTEIVAGGVRVTFPIGWDVEPTTGGSIARAPGAGAIALVSGEPEVLLAARNWLEKDAGALISDGPKQQTANAHGYPFFITNNDVTRTDGVVVRTTVGFSSSAASLGEPLVLLAWFRHDAPAVRNAIVEAIDTIEPTASSRAQQSKP